MARIFDLCFFGPTLAADANPYIQPVSPHFIRNPGFRPRRRFSTQARWDSNVGVAREVFFGTISDSRVCLFGSTLHLQRYLLP
jgi:hypothetical protein